MQYFDNSAINATAVIGNIYLGKGWGHCSPTSGGKALSTWKRTMDDQEAIGHSRPQATSNRRLPDEKTPPRKTPRSRRLKT